MTIARVDLQEGAGEPKARDEVWIARLRKEAAYHRKRAEEVCALARESKMVSDQLMLEEFGRREREMAERLLRCAELNEQARASVLADGPWPEAGPENSPLLPCNARDKPFGLGRIMGWR